MLKDAVRDPIKHISLSSGLQKRLAVAMEHLRQELGDPLFAIDPERKIFSLNPAHVNNIIAAYDAALRPVPDNEYARFGLSAPSAEETRESIELADALIEMSNGEGSPAIFIEGLPIDSDLNYLSLLGFSHALHSGQSPESDEYSLDDALRLTAVEHHGKELAGHAIVDLHCDFAGIYPASRLRILGGDKEGSNPLPTKIATAEEYIARVTEILWSNKDDLAQAYSTKEELCSAITKALLSPLWDIEVCLPSRDGEDLRTRAVLFSNPHYGPSNPDAVKYGFYTSAPCLTSLTSNANEVREGFTCGFLKKIAVAFEQAREDLKQPTSGEVLKAGNALIWNDHMVHHGPGLFQNEVLEPLGLRVLQSLSPRAAMANDPAAKFPGTNRIFCPVPQRERVSLPSNSAQV